MDRDICTVFDDQLPIFEEVDVLQFLVNHNKPTQIVEDYCHHHWIRVFRYDARELLGFLCYQDDITIIVADDPMVKLLLINEYHARKGD